MIQILLQAAGVFAVVLGLLHVTFPGRFGFPDLLSGLEPIPAPFRLGPYRKSISRSDVLGIVYVMNHATSFVIVSIGVFDLCAPLWLGTIAGSLVSVWAGAFWFLRVAAQLYLGHGRGSLLVMAVFSAIGLIQLLPIVGG